MVITGKKYCIIFLNPKSITTNIYFFNEKIKNLHIIIFRNLNNYCFISCNQIILCNRNNNITIQNTKNNKLCTITFILKMIVY